jgi:hypothetical protein
MSTDDELHSKYSKIFDDHEGSDTDGSFFEHRKNWNPLLPQVQAEQKIRKGQNASIRFWILVWTSHTICVQQGSRL